MMRGSGTTGDPPAIWGMVGFRAGALGWAVGSRGPKQGIPDVSLGRLPPEPRDEDPFTPRPPVTGPPGARTEATQSASPGVLPAPEGRCSHSRPRLPAPRPSQLRSPEESVCSHISAGCPRPPNPPTPPPQRASGSRSEDGPETRGAAVLGEAPAWAL